LAPWAPPGPKAERDQTRPSARRHAAVDDELGAGNKARFIRQQVNAHVGDLGRRAQPPERNLAGDAGARRIPREIPLGRLGTPAEVADMCVYLLSDESRFVTGAEFVIDGGLTAR